MLDTVSRYLSALASLTDKNAITTPLKATADRMSSQSLNTAGLVISAGAAATAKVGAADYYGIASGVLVKVAAGTAMPALVGSITAAKFNVFCFFIDNAGTVTSAMGTEGAAIGNIVFPQTPVGKAMLGFLLVTYASTFVGGTTALDTATTVYVNTVGAVDPTILL